MLSTATGARLLKELSSHCDAFMAIFSKELALSLLGSWKSGRSGRSWALLKCDSVWIVILFVWVDYKCLSAEYLSPSCSVVFSLLSVGIWGTHFTFFKQREGGLSSFSTRAWVIIWLRIRDTRAVCVHAGPEWEEESKWTLKITYGLSCFSLCRGP